MTYGPSPELSDFVPNYAANVIELLMDGRPANGVYYDNLILSGPGVRDDVDFDSEIGVQHAAYLHFPGGDPQTGETTEGLTYDASVRTEASTTRLRKLVLGLHVSEPALARINPRATRQRQAYAEQLEVSKRRFEIVARAELSGRRRDERVAAIRALTPLAMEAIRCSRAAAPLSVVALYDMVTNDAERVPSGRRMAVLYHSSLSDPRLALGALQTGAKRLGWIRARHAN